MGIIKEHDILVKPEGFISAFMHRGEPEFVQVGSEPNQGFYRLPKAEIEQEMHVKNLIVSMASQFMAKRMRPGVNWGAGIGYLEVGTGVGTGTTQVPQAEALAQTTLRVALFRRAIDSWTYLDGTGAVTASETNVIQLTTTFLEAEAIEGGKTTGAIVEMGLFGGDATAALSSGYMFNYKTFPVWNKANDMRLTIVWKITF